MISRENLLEQQLREKDIEIERLNNIMNELEDRIDKAIEYIEDNKAKLPQRRDDFTCEVVYSDEVVLANELLEILKGEE